MAIAPLLRELDEESGAVLTSLHANMVKVSAHHDDPGAGGAVGELSHGYYPVEGGVPSTRGLLRGLAEPAGFMALTLPDVLAVEDWRELSVFGVRSSASADVGP